MARSTAAFKISAERVPPLPRRGSAHTATASPAPGKQRRQQLQACMMSAVHPNRMYATTAPFEYCTCSTSTTCDQGRRVSQQPAWLGIFNCNGSRSMTLHHAAFLRRPARIIHKRQPCSNIVGVVHMFSHPRASHGAVLEAQEEGLVPCASLSAEWLLPVRVAPSGDCCNKAVAQAGK